MGAGGGETNPHPIPPPPVTFVHIINRCFWYIIHCMLRGFYQNEKKMVSLPRNLKWFCFKILITFLTDLYTFRSIYKTVVSISKEEKIRIWSHIRIFFSYMANRWNMYLYIIYIWIWWSIITNGYILKCF